MPTHRIVFPAFGIGAIQQAPDYSHDIDERYNQFYGALFNFIVHYFTSAYRDDFHPDNFQYNFQVYEDDFSFFMQPKPDTAYSEDDLCAVAESFLNDISRIADNLKLENINTIRENSDTSHRFGFSSKDMGQVIRLFDHCVKKYQITTLDNFGIGHFPPAVPRSIPSAVEDFRQRAGIPDETISAPTCHRVDFCPPVALDRDLTYVAFCRANYKPNMIPDSLEHVKILYAFAQGRHIDENIGLQLCH